MQKHHWCEHEKSSKYTLISHYVGSQKVMLRVQTWMCSKCGTHGAYTEVLQPQQEKQEQGAVG